MTVKDLTDAELLVLGLVAEMPRHGYQLNQVIEQRSMREWTPIGFSSIYFVLGQLEKMKLVTTKKRATAKSHLRTRKVYSATRAGQQTLVRQTLAALRDVRPAYSSVLLGMVNWPALQREEALEALQVRHRAIEAERTRLGQIQIDQQPLPDYVEAVFEYSLGQLKVEGEWVKQNLDYMASKPWLE